MSPIGFSSFSNIIDGEAVSTESCRHGVNPANNEELWPAPLSTLASVDDAVDAAKKAAKSWAATPLQERQQCVRELADALASHADLFARTLTLEQGKPIQNAKGEVAQAVQMLQGVAALDLHDTIVEDTDQRHVITRYIPVGVCVGIVPWNFPLILSIFKLGPALVAGNPIIMKPSPFTPYCGLKLAELAQRFFPPGVVQALSGDDNLGQWLSEHPGVDKVSFTGSTATGIKVMQSCAKTLKRVTLELGGNDPAIICPDVDVADVAPKIGTLALFNSGQVCIAIKRVYVHSSIYDDFIAKLASFTKSMSVKNGLEEGSDLGPVQNKMQYEKLADMVGSIKTEGLKVLTGDLKDAFPGGKGLFMNPVIVDNPPEDSKIVTEEPFGPVFPVLKWDTEEDVIRQANSGSNGLGASVWSRDPEQSDRIARKLEAGNVWINTHMELRPDATFGGLKQSGIGSELGMEGLKSYCNTQTIYGGARQKL